MMRDLPPTPFTEVSYKRLKADRNWHITCDYQYYSVPYQLVGKAVTVRLTPKLVSIFWRGSTGGRTHTVAWV